MGCRHNTIPEWGLWNPKGMGVEQEDLKQRVLEGRS